MFTIVVCSIDSARFQKIQAHYQELFGAEPFELIAIGDARSLSEAYNRAVAAGRDDYFIFSHDDIEFLSPSDWLPTLKSHLANFDIIGIAGTNRMARPSWAMSGPPYTFGQVAESDTGPQPYRVVIWSVPAPVIPHMQALDGVFLAVRREVLDRVKFDESLIGFHHYDVDFTFSAYRAGFRLAAVTNMPLLHNSKGKYDAQWHRNAARFIEKHGPHLSSPPSGVFSHSAVWVNTRQEIMEILRPRNNAS